MTKFEVALRVIWNVFGYILIALASVALGIGLLSSVAEGDSNPEVSFVGIGFLGIIIGSSIVITSVRRSLRMKDGIAAYGCLSAVAAILTWFFGIRLIKLYLGY